jgi:RimJ/RimL family protein N-acetyltransferase
MADPTFHITTPRLYLHYFLPDNLSHIDFLCETFTDRSSTKQQLAHPMNTRPAVQKDIQSRIADQTATGFGRYLISLRTSPSLSFVEQEQASEHHTYVGVISMKLRKHSKGPNVPDIGFFILPKFTGKGYATEAASGVLEYFENRGVKDVLGFCSPGNERSKAMFRRLGWEERGERKLMGMGDRMDDGVDEAVVWAKKGMDGDLAVYGI